MLPYKLKGMLIPRVNILGIAGSNMKTNKDNNLAQKKDWKALNWLKASLQQYNTFQLTTSKIKRKGKRYYY